MPTTAGEAEKILSITNEYLGLEEQKKLFVELNRVVGQSTGNESLRVSLAMMAQLVTVAARERSDRAGHYPWKVLLVTIVALHTFVVCGMLFSFCALPFSAEWYIALPLCSLIFFVGLNRQLECPLTRYENIVRRNAHLPPIKAFVSYYFIRPWRRG